MFRCSKEPQGNSVRIGDGPAAVTGDENRSMPLPVEKKAGRCGE